MSFILQKKSVKKAKHSKVIAFQSRPDFRVYSPYCYKLSQDFLQKKESFLLVMSTLKSKKKLTK
jgi:hypothetical protein